MTGKYEWEVNPKLNKSFFQGEVLVLNPYWPNFQYLQKEFGHLFPRSVQSVINAEHGDVVRFKLGMGQISFASQVLCKPSEAV